MVLKPLGHAAELCLVLAKTSASLPGLQILAASKGWAKTAKTLQPEAIAIMKMYEKVAVHKKVRSDAT